MSLHVFNAITLAPSEYADLDFVDLLDYNGVNYGVRAAGVDSFSGTTDNGTDIDCYIETGKLFPGVEDLACTRAYVRCQAADDLLLTATVDELNGDGASAETSVNYTMRGRTGTKQQTRTERLRSDIRGEGWSFKLANVDGGSFEIKDFWVDPEGLEIDA